MTDDEMNWPEWVAKYDAEGFCRACGSDLDFDHMPWCLIPKRDAEIVRLREAILKGHYNVAPNPIETINGQGEDVLECETCAELWPCWAADVLPGGDD